MAIRIRYDKNIGEIKKLMTSAEMAAFLQGIAEAAVPYARAISPRDSGDYEESFKVTSVRRGGPRNNRAEARITNTSDHATAVEFRNHGGQRVLGRVVDHIEGN